MTIHRLSAFFLASGLFSALAFAFLSSPQRDVIGLVN
jgi:hypothetical protein